MFFVGWKMQFTFKSKFYYCRKRLLLTQMENLNFFIWSK